MECCRIFAILKEFGGSSNGRTAAFEAAYLGSIPSPPVTMIPLLLVISLAQFLGDWVYVRNTFLGRSQPNRVTFFLAACVPAIAIAIGLVAGETWALLPIFMVGFGPLLIFIASFFNPKAYWKLSASDYLSGALAVVALILWGLTKEPITAVAFTILSDLFVWLPTLVKAWKRPETETGIGYAIAIINAAIGITLLQAYDFTHLGFLVIRYSSIYVSPRLCIGRIRFRNSDVNTSSLNRGLTIEV